MLSGCTLTAAAAGTLAAVCAAERYAEGITAGLALAGKKKHAVIMHLTDDPENQKALISKNLTFRHTDIYFRQYRNITPAISAHCFGAKA